MPIKAWLVIRNSGTGALETLEISLAVAVIGVTEGDCKGIEGVAEGVMIVGEGVVFIVGAGEVNFSISKLQHLAHCKDS